MNEKRPNPVQIIQTKKKFNSVIKLDVLLTPDQIANRSLDQTVVVVLDVLRATTSIAAALHAGAQGVLPVDHVERARQVAAQMGQAGESVLLCGEVGGLPPEGFDLGNSPREFIQEKIRGKKIILKTTNGTVALVRAHLAAVTVAGSLANVSAAVRFLSRHLASGSYEELFCLCAGREGGFSLEDFFAAGAILEGVTQSAMISAHLSDLALVALDYYRSHSRDPLDVLSQSEHGHWLIEIGLGKDLPICATIDKYPVVPICTSDNWIVSMADAE